MWANRDKDKNVTRETAYNHLYANNTLGNQNQAIVNWRRLPSVPQRRYYGRGIMPYVDVNPNFVSPGYFNQWNPAVISNGQYSAFSESDHSNPPPVPSNPQDFPILPGQRSQINNTNAKVVHSNPRSKDQISLKNSNHQNGISKSEASPKNVMSRIDTSPEDDTKSSLLNIEIPANIPRRRFFMRQKEIDALAEEEGTAESERESLTIMDRSDDLDEIVNANCKHDNSSFPSIIPSIRETTGGRNVQSNEAIEQRLKDRRQLYVDNSILDQSSSNESYTTASSDANESYKTAMSFNQMQAFQQSLKEKIHNESCSYIRYKKNAAIASILKNVPSDDNDYDCFDDVDDDQVYSVNNEGIWADARSGCGESEPVISVDVAEKFQSMQINGETDEDMRIDRLGRFLLYQSTEDEDVYVHPLREEVKKNPEWQNHVLSRKGIEVVYSPRQYYINLNDDDFDFVKPQKPATK